MLGGLPAAHRTRYVREVPSTSVASAVLIAPGLCGASCFTNRMMKAAGHPILLATLVLLLLPSRQSEHRALAFTSTSHHSLPKLPGRGGTHLARRRTVLSASSVELIHLTSALSDTEPDVLYSLKYFLVGGICAAVSHTGSVPLDVIKTRLQLDVPAPPDTASRDAFAANTTTFSTTTTTDDDGVTGGRFEGLSIPAVAMKIVEEEGPGSLWVGAVRRRLIDWLTD